MKNATAFLLGDVVTGVLLLSTGAAGYLFFENRRLAAELQRIHRVDQQTQTSMKKSDPEADRAVCIDHLRALDAVIMQWALVNKKSATDEPQRHDLVEILQGSFPQCPSGGTYSWGKVTESPTCTIPNHKLPP